mmetsp:Transcript_39071/g.83405  ORF Transcript_39071/g.83405 Transcript_39071/m.83405 type:complete len:211 (+) Transcript_39071:249-881(+)
MVVLGVAQGGLEAEGAVGAFGVHSRLGAHGGDLVAVQPAVVTVVQCHSAHAGVGAAVVMLAESAEAGVVTLSRDAALRMFSRIGAVGGHLAALQPCIMRMALASHSAHAHLDVSQAKLGTELLGVARAAGAALGLLARRSAEAPVFNIIHVVALEPAILPGGGADAWGGTVGRRGPIVIIIIIIIIVVAVVVVVSVGMDVVVHVTIGTGA